MPTSERILILLATYNEAENVERMATELLGLNLAADILFVDDNSPDGTGRLIDRMAATTPEIKVIHHAQKAGVGNAHQVGIAWAYDHGYSLLVSMDCDFTHSTARIPDLLGTAPVYDIVVGNRFACANSLDGWKWYRKLLTKAAHTLTAMVLSMPQDASGSFRLYRLDRIPREAFAKVRNRGYSFFWESLFVLKECGMEIGEVPIDLPARTYGTSKMRLSDILDGVRELASAWWRRTFDRESLVVAPTAPDRANTAQEWDHYWSEKRSQANDGAQRLYDRIAKFYRRHIIQPSLTRMMDKHFPAGARVLHAGCGSGEVDEPLLTRLNVTAMDFSPVSLARYAQVNGTQTPQILDDIRKIPVPDASFDGVYNLGVMEHFCDAEIEQVIAEFHRILKPGGKMVLFWPPAYGLSVVGLRIIHFILANILGKHTRLHPDEPSLLRSSAATRQLLERHGFGSVEITFGISDIFTYAVVVGKKKMNDNA